MHQTKHRKKQIKVQTQTTCTQGFHHRNPEKFNLDLGLAIITIGQSPNNGELHPQVLQGLAWCSIGQSPNNGELHPAQVLAVLLS